MPYAEEFFRFMNEAQERNLKKMREQNTEKPEDEVNLVDQATIKAQ